MRLSQAQQKLVESALPTVDHLARRAKRRFPEIPLDEFISQGRVALVDAVRNFDESRSNSFEVFAYKRVWGAMISDVPTERAGRLHVAVKRAFQADPQNFAPPADLDLDEALTDTPEAARARAVAWARKQAAGMLIAALKTAADSNADVERQVSARMERAHAEKMLGLAMAELDDNERYFVRRFYADNATLDTIAEELSVVKRTVSRLHDKIKTKLEKALRKRGVTSVPPSERSA
ncbi:MAG: sigma-70 family RNA polymerase sigma factor [Polyangiaceae bacterium]|nr:sigma-70 family RNA polymerase sigma factor [Polyangiaceae bacterium]